MTATLRAAALLGCLTAFGTFVPAARAAAAPADRGGQAAVLAEARRLLRDGDVEAAAERLRQAEQAGPSPDIAYELGLLYRNAEDFGLARDAFERTLQSGPDPILRGLADERQAEVAACVAADARLRALLPEARRLHKAGRAARALRVLKEAVRLCPHPRILRDLAGLFDTLRDEANARVFYERVLLAEPGPALAESTRERLGQLLAYGPGGEIIVRSEPPGAKVWLDEQDVGTTPAPIRALAPGVYRVEVRADGFEPVQRRVPLRGKETLTVRVVLLPAPHPPVDAPPKGGADPSPVTLVAPPRAPLRPWGYALIGVGGAALVAAIGCHAGAFRIADEVHAIDTDQPQANIHAEREDIRRRKDHTERAFGALYGVSAAALTAGVVLAVLGRTAAAGASPGGADSHPRVRPTGLGLTVTLP